MITCVTSIRGLASISIRRGHSWVADHHQAWALRLLLIAAAAITLLFIARDSLNFRMIETLMTVTLIIVFGVIAVG